ncbi:MAG: DEAD/DEAH box helicase [Chloroflexi bacterium]|nr:DEAD/DEAH box helicase [Chloroflexota bacterium]
MSVESALQALRLDLHFMRNVVAWRRIPAQPAQYAAFPSALDGRLVAALAERGIGQLYTHQAEAVAAALAGAHVAVVTPAASGKTLCYNLPVLHCLLADPHARGLYLFPTKALAQDQLAELNGLVGGEIRQRIGTDKRIDSHDLQSIRLSEVIRCPAATYDGDTPSAQRAKIRDAARIILSNPDMLHAGILPQHPRWAAFFSNLRVVVIDEMHVYRGVFGSHVANVLRRLRRICRFYGSEPQFILASATIANPVHLAEQLVEAPVTVIGEDRNAAPQGEREIIFYNPPLLDPALGIRRSSSLEAADLAAHFLAHDVQTIVFARARLTTELVLTHLREVVGAKGTEGTQGNSGEAQNEKRKTKNENSKLQSAEDGSAISNLQSPTSNLQSAICNLQSIRGYRGGYLPSERRDIERGLREGAVRGVVATNALELGIDIGALGAAVLAGYPGTVASTRQQMGRAGRRQGVSVAVMVATTSALDQYIVAHPDYVLARSPEHARLNPDNEIILAGHLACAAAELPMEVGTSLTPPPPCFPPAGESGGSSSSLPSQGRGAGGDRLLDDLVAAGQLYRAGDRYYWAGDGNPSAAIGLRTGSPDRVVIQTTDARGAPQVIGELDRFSVPLLLYQGAVYLHEGVTYLVERLDWDAGIAHVRPVEVDFYTRPSIGETVEVLAVRGMTDDERRMTNDRRPPTADPPQLPVSSIQIPVSSFQVSWGDVRVISQATGYRILRRSTNEMLGFGTIDLPEQALDTQACWLTFSEALIERLKAAGEWFSDPNDYGPNWPAQRNAARARDGCRCQNCGAAEPDSQRQHDVHHRVPFRAFVAAPSLRPGLGPQEAWQAANRLENLVTLCQACHRRAEASVRIGTGLGGVAALLAAVAPLTLMCDPADLGVVVEPKAPGSGRPTITLYERMPGGVGYAEQMYGSMPDLLAAAYDLVTACPCERGCPSCVGPVLEHEYALDTKALATALLREVHGATDSE